MARDLAAHFALSLDEAIEVLAATADVRPPLRLSEAQMRDLTALAAASAGDLAPLDVQRAILAVVDASR